MVSIGWPVISAMRLQSLSTARTVSPAFSAVAAMSRSGMAGPRCWPRSAIGAGRAERGCDLIDGGGLAGTDALAVLAVRGRDLVRHGENEAPVPVDLVGRCRALQRCHRRSQVPK